MRVTIFFFKFMEKSASIFTVEEVAFSCQSLSLILTGIIMHTCLWYALSVSSPMVYYKHRAGQVPTVFADAPCHAHLGKVCAVEASLLLRHCYFRHGLTYYRSDGPAPPRVGCATPAPSHAQTTRLTHPPNPLHGHWPRIVFSIVCHFGPIFGTIWACLGHL